MPIVGKIERNGTVLSWPNFEKHRFRSSCDDDISLAKRNLNNANTAYPIICVSAVTCVCAYCAKVNA